MNISMKRFGFFAALLMLWSCITPALSFAQDRTSDDVSGHWAEAQLDDWAQKGWLKGYDDGSLKPDQSVSRAEFVTLVNRAFGLNEKAEIHFTDVTVDNWAHEQIAKAVKAGILRGFDDGTFRPDQAISRQEAAVMVARLAGLEDLPGSAARFKDASDIAEWSFGAVGATVDAGLISGYPDETFRPLLPITRAEAVVVLERSLSQAETVFETAGTYGPETGEETINGNASVHASGVTLKNMTITGDLLLAEEIGEGDVFLENVKVLGDTIVEGGGSESIHLVDTVLVTVIVNKADGTVRLVAEGATSVREVVLQSAATLEEQGVLGAGFTEVSLTDLLPSGSKVTLQGAFETVNVAVKNISVEIPSGSVGAFAVTGQSGDIDLRLGDSAKIVSLVLEAAARIFGQGIIEKANISEQAGATTFERAPVSQEGAGSSPAIGNGGGGDSGDNGDDDAVTPTPKTAIPTVTGNVYANSVGFWGTAEPGAGITAAIGSGTVGQTKAGADGIYIVVFTAGTELTADSTLSVTARATGKTVSDAETVRVNAIPDDAPLTETPTVTDNVYTDSQGLFGETEPFASVIVISGDHAIGAALASKDGSYAMKFAEGTLLKAGAEVIILASAPGKATSNPVVVTVKAAPVEEPKPEPEPEASVKLAYLGHSSFVLSTDETTILMDPWYPGSFGLPEYAPPELPITTKDIDVLTVSHNHHDHYFKQAVEHAEIIEGIGKNNEDFYEVPNIDLERGGIAIRAVNVEHFLPTEIDLAPENIKFFKSNAANAAFIFETNDMRIVHLGDGMGPIEGGLSADGYKDLVSDLKGTTGIDILMIPIGSSDGESPLDHGRLIEAINTLQPKVVIPMHPWSTLDQFIGAATSEFGEPVYKSSEIEFSASDLPDAAKSVIWIMDESLNPIFDFKATDVTDTTVTLEFSQPVDAEVVKIQRLDGLDDDFNEIWVDVATEGTLDASSTSAVVTGLEPTMEYVFRLLVKGGPKYGISNRLELTTAIDKELAKLESLALSISGDELPFTFVPDQMDQGEIIVDQYEDFEITFEAVFDEQVASANIANYQPDEFQGQIEIANKELLDGAPVNLFYDVFYGPNTTKLTVTNQDENNVIYIFEISSRVEVLPSWGDYFVTLTDISIDSGVTVDDFINMVKLRPGATATVWTSYDHGTNEFGTQVAEGTVEDGYVLKITGLNEEVFRVYNIIAD